mmetsp:Transcript_96216/g.276431  ORF Transcript_96216/g.276431 Transcript_96216/m.276431 type:complete len:279 (-) Transcript_96216:579-1415(-)
MGQCLLLARVTNRTASWLKTTAACSRIGSTYGPNMTKFCLMALPATFTMSLESETPQLPSASSSWYTHLYESLSDSWQRNVYNNLYLARRASTRRLDSSKAQPPHRKSVFCSSMPFSLPLYIFCVMFSVEITNARAPGWFCNNCLAKSTEITFAEQPMPPRLYVRTSCRKQNSLHTNAQREGVGQNREQLMMRMSIAVGRTPVRCRTSLTSVKITSFASSRADAIPASKTPAESFIVKMPGGQCVDSPVPELSKMRFWNSSESGEKQPRLLIISTRSF